MTVLIRGDLLKQEPTHLCHILSERPEDDRQPRERGNKVSQLGTEELVLISFSDFILLVAHDFYSKLLHFCCYCSVAKSCPILHDHMDCSPPGLITAYLVAQNSPNVFSYGSGSLKSEISFPGLMSRHQQGWVLLEAPGKNLFPCLFQLPESLCIRWLWPLPPAQGLYGFPRSLARPSPDKTCCWERDPHFIAFGSGLSSPEPAGGSPTWRLRKVSADAICCWFAKESYRPISFGSPSLASSTWP